MAFVNIINTFFTLALMLNSSCIVLFRALETNRSHDPDVSSLAGECETS